MSWREVGLEDKADLDLIISLKKTSCCRQRDMLKATGFVPDNTELNQLKGFLNRMLKPKIFLWEDATKYIFIVFADNRKTDEIKLHYLGGMYKPTGDISSAPDSELREAFDIGGKKIKDYIISRGKIECYATASLLTVTPQAAQWFQKSGNASLSPTDSDYNDSYGHINVGYVPATKRFTVKVR